MIANIATLKQEIETRIAYEVADKNIPSISYTLVGRDGPIALGHVQRTDLEHSFSDQTTFDKYSKLTWWQIPVPGGTILKLLNAC